MMRLHLLGPLALEHEDGTSVGSVLAQPKRVALLAYLASTHPPSLHSRDTLVALLWPEADQAHARNSLRQTLHGLRRSLGQGVITGLGDERVGVDPARLWCDAAAFDAAMEAADTAEALGVYRGPLLDGFHVSDAPGFERWVEDERRRLAGRAVAGARQLAEAAEGSGDRAEARRWAERALEIAPYDEEVFRAYLALLHRQADRPAAVRAFETYESRLGQDLGLEPSAETRLLLERVRGDEPPPSVTNVAAETRAGRAARAAASGGARPGARGPRPERTWISALRGRRARVVALAVLVAGSAALGWRALRRGRRVPTAAAPLLAAGRTAASTPAAAIPPKSVAVLPFENLSADSANAYFAAGIQDEILTDLAHIADLKVISRESVLQYRSRPATASAIGRQLAVADLLEGSVQRIGDRVRISVQLIDARRDAHVWAATYDRDLSDVFAVESEVARQIAAALEARLTPDEARRLSTAPTRVAAAYQAYLRALAHDAHPRNRFDAADQRLAASAYAEAVKLDSTFALAWSRLASTESFLYFAFDHDPGELRAAKRAVDRAVALAPEAGETRLALGRYYYYGLRDFAKAEAAFQDAAERLPNSSEALASLSYVERRQGRWSRSIADAERALALDPRNDLLLHQTAGTYGAMRNFAEWHRLVARLLEVSPRDPEILADVAGGYQSQGDLESARRLLERMRVVKAWQPWWEPRLRRQFYLERDFDSAATSLRDELDHVASGPLSARRRGRLLAELSCDAHMSGQEGADHLDCALARQLLRAWIAKHPNDRDALGWLAWAEAGLGERGAALATARRVAALLPRSVDALSGPTYEVGLAVIEARVGEADSAIERVRRLLSIPSPLTTALLRVDPVWDPLRGDPRFQALLERRDAPIAAEP